jgi:hypothetical protein
MKTRHIFAEEKHAKGEPAKAKQIIVCTLSDWSKEKMSKASASEDSAPRSMRELVQKKFLEEVIDAAGERCYSS